MSLPETGTFRTAGLLGPIGLRARRIVTPRVEVPVVAPTGRDARLDMFRGIALLMIFINHVPGTVYELYTSRNFGFSDAAEAFVFMSGMAAGLAYSNRFRAGNLWAAVAKVWARARQLYFVHIVITMLSLGIFAGAAKWFGLSEVLTKNNIPPILQNPLSGMVGIPLLTHQLGYLNILPLYMVLLVATPLFLLIGLRKPWLMFGLSILLWIVAGQFRFNLPNFPTGGGWFFNPFSWQLLFVTGLLSGAAMKVGQRFIPYNRTFFWVCTAFVVLILLWVKVPFIGQIGLKGLGWAADHGAPFYITWFDKSYLALPRLLHALALFYVMGHLAIMKPLSTSAVAAPFRLLGQQGLPVFAVGTVISMGLQAVKADRSPDPLFDGLILGAGLLFLLALAWTLRKTQQITRAKAA